MIRIALIHGPNLNLLGHREPEIYGHQTSQDIVQMLRDQFPDITFDYFQSNHEGDLIDWLHGLDRTANGVILNAGAFTHTSIAIRDAIAAITTPVFEVHLSDLSSREDFRQVNYLKDVCVGHISGKGAQGYVEAVRQFVGG